MLVTAGIKPIGEQCFSSYGLLFSFSFYFAVIFFILVLVLVFLAAFKSNSSGNHILQIAHFAQTAQTWKMLLCNLSHRLSVCTLQTYKTPTVQRQNRADASQMGQFFSVTQVHSKCCLLALRKSLMYNVFVSRLEKIHS